MKMHEGRLVNGDMNGHVADHDIDSSIRLGAIKRHSVCSCCRAELTDQHEFCSQCGKKVDGDTAALSPSDTLGALTSPVSIPSQKPRPEAHKTGKEKRALFQAIFISELMKLDPRANSESSLGLDSLSLVAVVVVAAVVCIVIAVRCSA